MECVIFFRVSSGRTKHKTISEFEYVSWINYHLNWRRNTVSLVRSNLAARECKKKAIHDTKHCISMTADQMDIFLMEDT